MKIDEGLEKRINKLRKNYQTFSREDDLICEVSRWLHITVNSLIPNSSLIVAEGAIDRYEENKKGEIDYLLVKGLRETVTNAWKIYGKMEVAA